MSVSPAQLADFAKILNNHEALNAVRERMEHRLFKRYRTATPEIRTEINHIMDSMDLFFGELKSIDAESAQIEQDEIIPINQEVK